MKKKLLFLGALMLTSVGASAQWVAPEMPAKTSNLEDVVGEKIFLYNKEAGGFLRGLGKDGDGVHWGTRAGVDTAGIDTVIINKPYKSSVKEGTTETSVDDLTYPYWFEEGADNGDTYLLQVFKSHRNKEWDEMYFSLTDYTNIWIDRQNNVQGNTNFFWDITKNGNGSYAIKASPKIPLLLYMDELGEANGLIVKTWDGSADSIVAKILGGERLGVNLDDASKAVCFEGYDANLAYDWTIVKVSDYEAADIENFYLEQARYNAAITLKASLDKAKAEYPEVNFAAAEAIYNNAASTLEQLLAAQEMITEAIIAYQENLATPDNPTDMTDAIINPSFDVLGDFAGWSGTKFGVGGNQSTNAEHYEKTFNSYQDIRGLPTGVYAVAVKGFYRAGSAADDWATKDDPSYRLASLYARSGTDSLATPLASLSSFATTETFGAPDVTTVGDNGEFFVPATMKDFTVYNEAGKIKDVVVILPVFNGNLRIGVVKTKTIGADWTIVDDFTLKYYGNTQAAYDAWKEQVVANYPSVESVIPDAGTLYSPSYLAAYGNAIANAMAESVPANMGAKIAAIQPALDSLYANIAAYKEYLVKADEVQNELANNTGLDAGQEDVAYLSDYFIDSSTPEDGVYPHGGYEYITGGDAELTTAQIKAEIAKLSEWLSIAIRNGISEGADCTNMLVNPAFAGTFDGWTNSEGGSVSGKLGELNVEVYEDDVDVCQTIKDVHPGVYSISVQAYERPFDSGFDGTEKSKTYVFMNGIQSPVMNIAADAMSNADAIDMVNCYNNAGEGGAWPYDTDFNGMWIPTSIYGAHYAFIGGRYVNKCYGIVGEDGVMKIGLTSNGERVHWVIWANFRLTYEGKNEDAIQSILESTIEQAVTYMEEHGGDMTTPALNVLIEAISNAENTVGSDYETTYAAIHAVNTAIADARANVEAYAAHLTAVEVMYTTLSEYEATASIEALEKMADVMDKIDYAVDLTTEEIIALTEEVETVTSMLKIPASDGASDENPVNMTSVIANADFSNGASDGSWTVVKEGIQNGPDWGGGSRADNGFEFWNGEPTSMKFDIYQILSALPEGKYALGADLANSLYGRELGTNGGRAHLYATVITCTESETYSVVIEPQEEYCDVLMNTYEVIFDMPADAKVQVGVKSVGIQDAQWFAGDNFTLNYFGTESAKDNSDNSVSIEDVIGSAEIVDMEYYSISGTRLETPSKGINIVRQIHADGKVTVKKLLIK